LNIPATSFPSFDLSTSLSSRALGLLIEYWVDPDAEPPDLPVVDPDAVRPMALDAPLIVLAKNVDEGRSASSLTLDGAHASPSPRSNERPFVPDRCPTFDDNEAGPLPACDGLNAVDALGSTEGTGTGARSRPLCVPLLRDSRCLSFSSRTRSRSFSAFRPDQDAVTSGNGAVVPVLVAVPVLHVGEGTDRSKENAPCCVPRRRDMPDPLAVFNPGRFRRPVALLMLEDLPVFVDGPVPAVDVELWACSEGVVDEPWGVV
jgi:hypothetical protein